MLKTKKPYRDPFLYKTEQILRIPFYDNDAFDRIALR